MGLFSKGPKEQVITNKLDPSQQRWNDEMRRRATEVADTPYSTYGGQRVAGADPMSNAAAQGMSGMGQNFLNMAGQAQGMTFGGGVNPNMDFGSGLQTGRQFGQDLSRYDDAGRIGADALSGDDGAVNRLMNPFQDQVIGAMGAEYDRMRGKALMGGNDMATRGGAFGGSRHALMQGERLGAIDRSQMETIAGLLQGGFNDAMGRAGQAAGLGLNAAGQRLQGQGMGADFDMGVGNQRLQAQGMDSQYRLGVGAQQLQGQGMRLDANGQAIGALGQAANAYGAQFGMGDYYRNIDQQGINADMEKFNEKRDWDLRGLNILTSAGAGLPYGTSQSQPLHRNTGAGILGGAATGAQIGSVIPGVGTAVGAGVGGLLGLFG
jgi:hypothetical protein